MTGYLVHCAFIYHVAIIGAVFFNNTSQSTVVVDLKVMQTEEGNCSKKQESVEEILFFREVRNTLH